MENVFEDFIFGFIDKELEIIQPKIIICFGVSDISAYAFLLALLNGEEYTPFLSGLGKWNCRAFKTIINGRNTIIIGIPHLSYYNIVEKDDVINWIRNIK